MVLRIEFQSAMREATMSLLEGYKASTGLNLQTYPRRPASLHPPSAFIDAINEQSVLTGPRMRLRTVRVEVVVIHGIFDSKEAGVQKDEFVDGFIDWVTDHAHEAGGQTILSQISTDDVPFYIPEWLAPEYQRSYYATTIVLEGYANG